MLSATFPPRRPSALLRYLVPAFLLCLAIYYLSGTGQDLSLSTGETHTYVPPLSHSDESKPTYPEEETTTPDGHITPSKPDVLPITTPAAGHTSTNAPASGAHPIDTLIANAEKDFSAVLAKESHTLADAAKAYRDRRGRHPPPGFDLWYNFAKENNAVVVEDFWDQVYHDLEPFWAIKPGLIRKQAWDYEMTINVRDRKATAGSDWFWTQIWLTLVQSVEHLLPDLDIALNAMDEPRLVVPWEDIDAYMTDAHKTRKMAAPGDVISEYQKLAKPGDGPDKEVEVPVKEWEDTSTFSCFGLAAHCRHANMAQGTTGKSSVAAAHRPASHAKRRS